MTPSTRAAYCAIVFFGAGFGGVLRFLIGGWVQTTAGPALPWGTFVVNVTGSMLLAFLLPIIDHHFAAPGWRVFLAAGFFGGYTTFSTFSYESVRLMQDGAWFRAGVYVLGSVIFCLAGAGIGFRAASLLLQRG